MPLSLQSSRLDPLNLTKYHHHRHPQLLVYLSATASGNATLDLTQAFNVQGYGVPQRVSSGVTTIKLEKGGVYFTQLHILVACVSSLTCSASGRHYTWDTGNPTLLDNCLLWNSFQSLTRSQIRS